MKRITAVGAGSWGTALGIVAARAGCDVRLWSRNELIVDSINHHHLNPMYLANIELPATVCATTDIGQAVKGADLVLLTVPSQAVRTILHAMLISLSPRMLLVSAAKGIEIDSGLRISQVVQEVVAEEFAPR